MAVYCPVYDSRHLQAELPRTGISFGTLRSVIEYGLPLVFLAAANRPARRNRAVDRA